jgi:hypothetical protein
LIACSGDNDIHRRGGVLNLNGAAAVSRIRARLSGTDHASTVGLAMPLAAYPAAANVSGTHEEERSYCPINGS